MLKADYFTYAGKDSSDYGLRIVSFDEHSSLNETVIFSPTITTEKSKASNKFFISGITYDEPTEVEITIARDEDIIEDVEKREIVSWLSNGREFQRMNLYNDGELKCYYLCKFKQISEICIGNSTVGFKLLAIFASPYQFKENTSSFLDSSRSTKETDSSKSYYNYYTLAVDNKSDIEDYIYPKIEICLTSCTEINIVNTTDDESREFKLSNVSGGNTITINNELKIITGNNVSLENFNFKWLRLIKGKNTLKIKFGSDGNGGGTVKIDCPYIVNIGY